MVKISPARQIRCPNVEILEFLEARSRPHIHLRSPLRWYGGKGHLLPYLLPLIPPHRRLVEVFGGAARLVLALPPSSVTIYNDLDPNLSHFWRVLRDPILALQLMARLESTPYTKDEYARCQANYAACLDPVEKARQFFVLVRQSFNGCFNAGWSRPSRPADIGGFYTATKRLNATHQRLQQVTLEQLDFRELLAKYDGPDDALYLDPPYHPETRAVTKRYGREMTAADHDNFLAIARQLRGMVIISGYPHPTYDRALSDWERIDIDVPNHAAQFGNGAIKNVKQEVIWLNRRCSDALTLRNPDSPAAHPALVPANLAA